MYQKDEFIIGNHNLILVTGASGFIRSQGRKGASAPRIEQRALSGALEAWGPAT